MCALLRFEAVLTIRIAVDVDGKKVKQTKLAFINEDDDESDDDEGPRISFTNKKKKPAKKQKEKEASPDDSQTEAPARAKAKPAAKKAPAAKATSKSKSKAITIESDSDDDDPDAAVDQLEEDGSDVDMLASGSTVKSDGRGKGKAAPKEKPAATRKGKAYVFWLVLNLKALTSVLQCACRRLGLGRRGYIQRCAFALFCL